MKGVRFYQDANGGRARSNPHRWKKDMPDGFNGLVLFPENVIPHSGCVECVAALYEGSGDGPYSGSSVARQYLDENCRRISEAEARQLFPKLVADVEYVPSDLAAALERSTR